MPKTQTKQPKVLEAAKLPGEFGETIWWLNLLFLPVCLSALTRLMGVTLVVGLLLGIVAAVIIQFVRQGSSPKERRLELAMRIAIGINASVLFATVLLSGYFLWTGLLNDSPPDIAEHTVILFFLLGLGCVGILLRFLYEGIVPQSAPEERLRGLIGGPSLYMSFCVAVILTSLTLVVFYSLSGNALIFLKQKFLQRGIIPPLCLILFYWELVLLAGKYYLSLRHLRQAVAGSALSLLWQDYSHKKSRGKKQDAVVSSFINTAWQISENFYFVPRYINWAIPILGFIGTVLGISLAAGEIGNIVGSASVNVGDSINAAMRPLSIAFDTTLIALSLSVFLAFLYTALQRWEEQKFLFLEEHLGRGS